MMTPSRNIGLHNIHYATLDILARSAHDFAIRLSP